MELFRDFCEGCLSVGPVVDEYYVDVYLEARHVMDKKIQSRTTLHRKPRRLKYRWRNIK
jgi:hypothetical protein